MAVIRWGAVNGPGVGVEENIGGRQIVGAPLGKIASPGILDRGPVGKMMRIRTPEEFDFFCGSRMWDTFSASFKSYLADHVLGYFKASEGAGEALLVRLEGTDAVKASVTFPSRLAAASGGGDSLTLRAANPGRWGGRAQAATLTGAITAVGETSVTIGAANYVVNEWTGATITNTTRSHSFVVQSNTATVYSAPSDELLVTDHSYVTGDTVTINLPHDAQHLAFEIEHGDVDPTAEFALTVYLDGRKVWRFPRLSMDPNSPRYVVTVLNTDPRNRYPGTDERFIEAVDAWAAASKTYVDGANPANLRSVSTGITATVLTDSTAAWPTKAVEGYNLVGGWVIHPTTLAKALIQSNTATTITVVDSYDLTTVLGAHPQDFEIIAPIRAAGGKNDHDQVTTGSYVTQLTSGTSAFDVVEDGGFGQVWMGIPGLSGFAAADRKTINDLGLTYCQGRPWEWQIETAATITVGGTGQTETELLTVRDFLFDSSGNNLGLDTIWGWVGAVSWGIITYPEFEATVVMPTMGRRLGIQAKQAASTGGYVDPGAGITPGSLPDFSAIDLDPSVSQRALLEKFAPSGMNFIIRHTDGRFYPFGARLPQKTQPQWTFSTHRQAMNHYAHTFLDSEALARAVLRPNTPELRAQVMAGLTSFLRGEYDAGRLDQSIPFDEAAVVNVGSEVNTAAVSAQGLLIAEAIVALPNLAERVRIRASKAGVDVGIG